MLVVGSYEQAHGGFVTVAHAVLSANMTAVVKTRGTTRYQSMGNPIPKMAEDEIGDLGDYRRIGAGGGGRPAHG